MTAADQPQPDPNADACAGAALGEIGELQEAAEIFRSLFQRTELANGLRAIVAVNLATVYDKMGHVDTAIQTYEYAVTIALRMYVWAEEGRAEYLFKHKRLDDAIAVWDHILTLPFLPDEVVKRIEHNLTIANENHT